MTDDAPKPPPDKTLRWLIGIVVAVVVLVGGYLVYRWALRRGVEKRYAAIRAAGQPVTLKELAEWYPTPPLGLNGADVYGQAFLKYSDTGADNENLPVVGEADLPELGEPVPPDMLTAIREYLAANEDALVLLHEAAAYDECRYPINMIAGPAARLQHLASLRQAARLLYLQAILESEDGDAEGAVRAIQNSLAAAQSLRNEPIFISRLVQMACDSISRLSFERVLSRTELTDAQLAAVRDAFANAETPEGMTRAFVGERCQGIALFENPAMLAGAGGSPALPIVVFQFTGLLDINLKGYLDIMNPVVDSSLMPPSERPKLFASVEKQMVEMPAITRVFAGMTLPALGSAVAKDMSDTAQLRCAATAAAVERYRLAAGKFPDQLSEIVPEFIPEIPTDPFTGARLLYNLTDDGCIVYSVGPDGKDDNGIEYAPPVKGQPRGPQLDLPFRLLKRESSVEE